MTSRYLTNNTEPSVLAHLAGDDLSAPRAYRISDVCRLTGLGRTSIYAAIKAGDLTARHWHRCTIVLAEDLAAFLRNLPTTR
jgi:hypothetical protein